MELVSISGPFGTISAGSLVTIVAILAALGAVYLICGEIYANGGNRK